jgi:hypothetical protein
LSSPALREAMLRCGKGKLVGSVSCMELWWCSRSTDRGWEAAWAADNGDQGLRWRSGEGLRSGRENAVD